MESLFVFCVIFVCSLNLRIRTDIGTPIVIEVPTTSQGNQHLKLIPHDILF